MDKDDAETYQITVAGVLDTRWSGWLADLVVTIDDSEPSITVLRGQLDQTALRGVLNRLWDLNLTLISVRPISRETPTETMGGSDDD